MRIMVKVLQLLIFLQVLNTVVVVRCQEPTAVDQQWNWVIPLQTKKREVEKVFGESITADKTHPFQTYVAKFGKITVVYNTRRDTIKSCDCVSDPDLVLWTFVSPERFKLTKLKLDLNQFEKDATYSPREISYWNPKEGLLIVTGIFELSDKTTEELVLALEYRPKEKR